MKKKDSNCHATCPVFKKNTKTVHHPPGPMKPRNHSNSTPNKQQAKHLWIHKPKYKESTGYIQIHTDGTPDSRTQVNQKTNGLLWGFLLKRGGKRGPHRNGFPEVQAAVSEGREKLLRTQCKGKFLSHQVPQLFSPK